MIELLRFPKERITPKTPREEIPTGREIVDRLNEIIEVVNWMDQNFIGKEEMRDKIEKINEREKDASRHEVVVVLDKLLELIK